MSKLAVKFYNDEGYTTVWTYEGVECFVDSNTGHLEIYSPGKDGEEFDQPVLFLPRGKWISVTSQDHPPVQIETYVPQGDGPATVTVETPLPEVAPAPPEELAEQPDAQYVPPVPPQRAVEEEIYKLLRSCLCGLTDAQPVR